MKILSNCCHDPILEDGDVISTNNGCHNSQLVELNNIINGHALGELNLDSTTHLLHDYMKFLDERATMLLGIYPIYINNIILNFLIHTYLN